LTRLLKKKGSIFQPFLIKIQNMFYFMSFPRYNASHIGSKVIAGLRLFVTPKESMI